MWLKLKLFALALLLVNSVASANDISQLDGIALSGNMGIRSATAKALHLQRTARTLKLGKK